MMLLKGFPRLLGTASLCLLFTSLAQAEILPGDLILGLGRSDGLLSFEHVRGPATEFGGEFIDTNWDEPFIQAVEFDNLNGISHNPNGNLLGVNFGSSGDDGVESGTIVNLATQASAGDTDQLIGDTNGGTLEVTRLGGLSVSPGNDKIAVTGYDSARVMIFDYAAGNGEGTGAALSGARQTGSGTLGAFSTQGTTWMDNNTLLAFSADGDILSINSATMDATSVATLDVGDRSSRFTDIDYNPTLSPYVYATHSSFDGATFNSLFVLDPNDGFSLVKTLDLSLSTNTLREIALGPVFDGEGDVVGANLYMSQFDANIDVLTNVQEVESLADDSAIDWYTPFTRASFSGVDVAVGTMLATNPTPDGDFNDDGSVDALDIDLLTGAVGGNDAAYDLNGDTVVDNEDRRIWVEEIANTYFGDSNLDGLFDTTDLVTVFAAGQYEDDVEGNSTWASGDWDGTGDFDTGDLVAAFSAGGYEAGPRTATAAVPEPSTALLGLLGLLGLVRRRR